MNNNNNNNQNTNFDIEKYLLGSSRSLKDYILLIRNNLGIFFTISLVIIAAAIAYAILAKDIYKSTVTLKITNQKRNILESYGAVPEVNNVISNRFISNEIEVINNYDSREKYAKALIDSFENAPKKESFNLIKDNDGEGVNGHKTIKDLTESLKDIVSAEQVDGMDIVEISAESPSPYEAALIANTCADQYKEINLESNRNKLTIIRKFLEKQSSDKLVELNNAEDTLKNFQERGGIVALDEQSKALINSYLNWMFREMQPKLI